MKKWQDSSFRTRLRVSNMIVIILVVSAIVFLMTVTASRETEANNRASLDLITRQALENFTASVKTVDQGLNTACSGSDIQDLLLRMRGMSSASHAYTLAEQEMRKLLDMAVNDSLGYDHLALLPDGKSRVLHSEDRSPEATDDADKLLAMEQNRAVTYGRKIWTRLADGSLWEIRDVYHTSPFRHVARIAGRVKQERLVGTGEAERSGHLVLLYLDRNGQLLSRAGVSEVEVPDRIGELIGDSATECSAGSERYALSAQSGGDWTVVGLQPMDVMKAVSRHLTRIAMMALAAGAVAALASSTLFSRGITARIQRLVDAMNEVAKGDLSIQTPVEGKDEISLITSHFNQTTRQTRELLDRVVREESNKQMAEYRNLEYEYRFLQWQINPHFIYNALETLNALGKLDGNDELCEMVVSLSGYFRQNAENMKKRFVTVAQELKSVMQYAEIYSQIHGGSLKVNCSCDEETGKAYVPTMIVQPLLENALIHGVSAVGEGGIDLKAEVAGDRLEISIKDNGPGMSQEKIDMLLGSKAYQPSDTKEEKTSLGVRNVRDRLNLLFGERASLTITSMIGQGTRVRITMPASQTEFPEQTELPALLPEK